MLDRGPGTGTVAVRAAPLVAQGGLTPGGALGVPSQPWDIGQYELDPSPGTVGNAVMDRHGGYHGVGPATFWGQRSLRPGDQLAVVDEDGQVPHFAAPDVASYLAWDLSHCRVFGLADSPRLHLVACTGVCSARQHDSTAAG